MSMITTTDTKLWTHKPIAQFTGKKALVLNGAFYGSCVALFVAAGFEIVHEVEEADVVVFIGGVDVDPTLYGQKRISQTQAPSTARDNEEKEVYARALKRGIPMFGICRGAQLLHVLNGGQLWQHVDNHAGPDHLIYDCEDDVFVSATSYHHQMLALNEKIEIIAVTKDQISHRFLSDTMTVNLAREGANADVEIEIEAGCYWDTKCFFVQGHPEVGSQEYKSWTMAKFCDFWDELEVGGYMTGKVKDVDVIIDNVEIIRSGINC